MWYNENDMEVQTTHRLNEGTILDGRYEIGSVLGEGGFGITYGGVNKNTGVHVAIKEFFCREYMGRDSSGTGRTILIDNTADRRFASEKRRFLREARIIRDYQDEPGVVTVLDYFEENDTAYIVMERIEGENLRSYVRSKGRIDAKIFFSEIHPLMQSLQILHRAGVIHRDISPDNIIRTNEGRMVLIDFGSAKDLSSETRSATMTVKDGYTPPEQYKKGAEPSVALDIYALSATMYYCLTGFVPQASIHRVLYDELEPVSATVMIPKEINDLISAGMSLKAEDRPKDIDAMLEVIDSVYKIIPPEEKARRKKRKRMIAAAIIAVVVLGAGFGATHVIKNIAQYRMMMQSTIVTHYSWDDAKDMKQTKGLLKKRIEAFAGENHYLFTEKKDEVIVEIPTALMGEAKPENIVEPLFQSPYAECCLIDTDEQGNAQGYIVDGNDARRNELVFDAADIEKLSIGTGPIPIGETSTAAIRHLTITLKDHVAKDNEELLSGKGKLLVFSPRSSDYGCHTFSAGDKKTVYLVDNYAHDQVQYDEMISCTLSGAKNKEIIVEDNECGDFYGVIKNNLEEKSGAYSSPDCNTELIVNWEQAGSTGRGKNQCEPDEVKGEFMLLSFGQNWNDEAKEAGDEAKSMIAFKNRLDALQTPYAFGRDAYHEQRFVIKVKKDALKQSEVMILGEYNLLEITNGYNRDIFSATATEDQEDGIRLDIDADSDSLRKIADQNEKYNIDHVYLCNDSIPLAVMDTEDFVKAIGGETMVFSDLCTEGIDQDEERRRLHEDFITAVDRNEMAESYEMIVDSIEVHNADGSYREQGSYSSFEGTCYGNELKLMDTIQKEREQQGITVGNSFESGNLDLQLAAENLETGRFKEQAVDLVRDCMKRYTFYDTDTHLNAVDFILSNIQVKDDGEDRIKATITIHPDMLSVSETDDPSKLQYSLFCSVAVRDAVSGERLGDREQIIEEYIEEKLGDMPQIE